MPVIRDFMLAAAPESAVASDRPESGQNQYQKHLQVFIEKEKNNYFYILYNMNNVRLN